MTERLMRPFLPVLSPVTEQVLLQGKVSSSPPHLQLPEHMRKIYEGCTKLLLNSYNNVGNNKSLFNIDKWLQTTEGATVMNILKEPGTRKLYFLESDTGQKAFSPGRLKYIT